MVPCKYPLCSGEGTNGGWCSRHKQYQPAPFKAADGERLDTPWSHLYRKQDWRRFRKAFLAKNPTCVDFGVNEGCTKKADSVDHFVMSAPQMWETYGRFILEDFYYQSRCRHCNSLRWNKERKVEAVPAGARSFDDLWGSCRINQRNEES